MNSMSAHRAALEPEGLAGEQLVLQSIFHAARALKLALHPELEREGLTIPMWWALHELALDGAMSVGAIASACIVTPANISAAADELVRGGLADRRSSTEDRRVTLLTATAKGRSVHRQIWTRTVTRFGESLKGVPRAELESTARVLSRLAGPDPPAPRGSA